MAQSRKDSKGYVLKTGELQRSNGCYEYRWTGADGKRHCISSTSLTGLREKEKALQEAEIKGIDLSAGKVTLNQLFHEMMETKGNIKETSRANYERSWKDHVETSMIGNMKIADIKQQNLKSFYKKLNETLKASTIKKTHALISMVLKTAVQNDIIYKNPADGAFTLKNDTAEKVPLSEQQFDDLIEFCNDTIYNIHVPFLQIAVGTCMRVGELCGLTWNDVDMRNRTIDVNHQITYTDLGDGYKFHILSPKTEAGKRVIPMTETVYQAFVELKKMYVALGYRCSATVDGYTDFVFFTKKGVPFSTDKVASFLTNIENAYNRKNPENPMAHLHPHILRHTGCTLYAAAGMDVKVLQNFMGHSDAGTTLNIYNHTSLERTQAELQRIERLRVANE